MQQSRIVFFWWSGGGVSPSRGWGWTVRGRTVTRIPASAASAAAQASQILSLVLPAQQYRRRSWRHGRFPFLSQGSSSWAPLYSRGSLDWQSLTDPQCIPALERYNRESVPCAATRWWVCPPLRQDSRKPLPLPSFSIWALHSSQESCKSFGNVLDCLIGIS